MWALCPLWPPSLRPSVDGLSPRGPGAPGGGVALCPSQEASRVDVPRLPKDSFSRCQEGRACWARMGWARSQSPLGRPALAGAELKRSSQPRPLSSARSSRCPEPLTVLSSLSVLQVEKLRWRARPSPPAGRRALELRLAAGQPGAERPRGHRARGWGGRVRRALGPPAAKASFPLSAQAALWAVADILKVHAVSVQARGLCSVCRSGQP